MTQSERLYLSAEITEVFTISSRAFRASMSPILAAAQASGGVRASRMASSSFGHQRQKINVIWFKLWIRITFIRYFQFFSLYFTAQSNLTVFPSKLYRISTDVVRSQLGLVRVNHHYTSSLTVTCSRNISALLNSDKYNIYMHYSLVLGTYWRVLDHITIVKRKLKILQGHASGFTSHLTHLTQRFNQPFLPSRGKWAVKKC